jgi:hypothetical protein
MTTPLSEIAITVKPPQYRYALQHVLDQAGWKCTGAASGGSIGELWYRSPTSDADDFAPDPIAVGLPFSPNELPTDP